MSKVTGATQKKPSGPFWYWTQLGPENINLADRTVELPPGSYDLFWDFRGKAGDTLQIALVDDRGRQLTALVDTIAQGDTESWGQKLFKVLP